jgi:GGDEF domain-containing protein
MKTGPDALTGCRTDLRGLWFEAVSGHVHCRLQGRYLCIDVDDFKRFIDHEGLPVSDGILTSIGRALRAHYGDDAVFRTGGEEFVVALGDAPVAVPPPPRGITLKHCLLDVDVEGGRRHHHALSLLLASLARAMVEATPEGSEIVCRYRPPLD